MQQSFFGFSSAQFSQILLSFVVLKLRADIIVIHHEFQDLLIPNGICNDIRMKLATKDRSRCFRPQGIFHLNRRPCKAKLTIFLELLFQTFLGLAKLRPVALIKDEDHLLVINLMLLLTAHEIVEFLDGGHNDFVVIFFDISLEPSSTVGTIDRVW